MLNRTLSLPEELLLLLLNPESGKLEITDRVGMRAALGGAVLLELSLQGRIDSDITHITLIDDINTSEELGPAEAYVYRRLFGEQDLSIRHWVYETYEYFDLLRDMLMNRMLNEGMISQRTKSYFGLFKKRRYVLAESAAQRDVKRRLMTVLFSDDIPTSRDIALVSLCTQANLFASLLTTRELLNCDERIRAITRMEVISISVCNVVGELYQAYTQGTHIGMG